ncbi:MAG: PIG-L family deacetylase [Bacteroidota bacterium]|nr:PIG-L family deacetylase [Bacteroidota bacterium]
MRFFFHFFLFTIIWQSSSAQSSSAEIYKDIKKFGVLANVLYVAAHPDDENTRLISYMSNHVLANTTYLSMTRGDGGQNLIGPEIREMLGIIRTQELLAARRIDGGNQLFTRANDFGYSKTAAETFTIWNREEVLSDVVFAIRKTRPDVIINRFNTDTGRPNHGHHTGSAILSTEAFDLANDPKAFPEQLKYVAPWQPRRIYFNTSWFFYGSRESFDKTDKSKMLSIDIGAFDGVTGESNSEIAGRSRSMHKSQGFGSAETRGESLDYLDLVKDAGGIIPKNLFEGINITWTRVDGGAPIAEKVKKLESTFNFTAPSQSVALLLEIHKQVTSLPDSYWKTIKLKECNHLIQECLGLFAEARTTRYQLTPGEVVPVSLEIINRSPVEVVLEKVHFQQNDSTYTYHEILKNNQGIIKDILCTVPDDLSFPYWLENTPKDGMYVVPEQQMRGIPADNPSIISEFNFLIAGSPFTFQLPLVYKTVDPAEGEILRPVYITPPVTIAFDDPYLVFNVGQERKINLTLSAIQDSTSGTLNLTIPDAGWKVTPDKIPFSFAKSGESVAMMCTITPPKNDAHTTLRPEIIVNGKTYHHSISVLDYDHLPYMSIVRDATVPLRSMDIHMIDRPIAYIKGAGDEVANALNQIGYSVDILNPESITPASLSKYQVVILGVRAFNTVGALAYKNKTLFDWVNEGGTMIVQYNISRGLVTESIAPYPITLSRDRVTEESTPINILLPDHVAFSIPNKIQASDFEGWVQERGLYFPNQWDPQFQSLLEMNDTGEAPLKGALLVAPYGKGYYVYSGLSWFRHLPAGVPGAYRLLSNLISLGYKNGKS